MKDLEIYGEMPEFLTELAETPEMLRLRDVGMNCGCEYTQFPLFRAGKPYSRYEHSLGVGCIVWNFTHDPAQAAAGLLHDIATPTFAHVIDFLRGDHLRQEATEAGTGELIAGSPALRRVLEKHGLSAEDVENYHRYPVADNDTPRLSADRLEYTVGNAVNWDFGSRELLKELYENIFVGVNEYGAPELCFSDGDKALEFARLALRCSRVYVSDPDRWTMQALAELLKEAVSAGVLSETDFRGTETALLKKLTASPHFAREWERFCACGTVLRAERPESGEWRRIPAKRRYIDPFVFGRGRVSALYPEHGAALAEFLRQSQDLWILGR